MALRIQTELDGVQALVRKLDGLRASLRRKVLRSAMRKATSIVNKRAKGMAPRRTGQLRKSLGVVVKVYPSGVVLGVVEPRKNFKIQVGTASGRMKNVDPRFYAHLVERGAKAHSVARRDSAARRGGKLHPGARPQPFLSPAFTASTSQIVAVFDEEIGKAVAAV